MSFIIGGGASFFRRAPPRRGRRGKFWEWEDQADALDRELTGGFLEILGQLSGQAKLEDPGACPFCGSKRVRWLDVEGQRERRSKHGEVVLPRQNHPPSSSERGGARREDRGGGPFCGGRRVGWLDVGGRRERESKQGEVVLPRQNHLP